MHVDGAAERSLREHGLGADAVGVIGPAVEPVELPPAEQFQSGQVDGRAVVGRIGDVVGPGTELRDRALGAGLELPVFEDREIEAAEHQPGEIDRDPLLHRCGIDGVGQVPGLLPLHHVHVGRRIVVPAVGAGLFERAFAVRAPKVRVAHVVVVGDRDRGPIAEDVAELQAELDPAHGVLRVAVGLVAREKQEIGIENPEIRDQLIPRAGRARRVAGEHGDADPLVVGRIAADRAGERGLPTVADSVGHRPRRVPVGDAEVDVPAGIEHGGPVHLLPAGAAIDLQPRLQRLARPQRKQLGGELEHARGGLGLQAHGVDREGDHVAARHVERERPGRLRPAPAVAGNGPRLGPPVARGPAVEPRVLVTERRWIERVGHHGWPRLRRRGGLWKVRGCRDDGGGERQKHDRWSSHGRVR